MGARVSRARRPSPPKSSASPAPPSPPSRFEIVLDSSLSVVMGSFLDEQSLLRVAAVNKHAERHIRASWPRLEVGVFIGGEGGVGTAALLSRLLVSQLREVVFDLDATREDMLAVAARCPAALLDTGTSTSTGGAGAATCTAAGTSTGTSTGMAILRMDSVAGTNSTAGADYSATSATNTDTRTIAGTTRFSSTRMSGTGTGITRVSLSGSEILDRAMLSTLLSGWPHLSVLDLSACCHIGDRELAVLSASRCASVLTSLDLSWCDEVTDAGLVAIAGGRCPNLATLDVSWCQSISDLGLAALVESCGEALCSLAFACCGQITDGTLRRLAQHCPRLVSVNMSKCHGGITAVGLRLLKDVFNHRGFAFRTLDVKWSATQKGELEERRRGGLRGPIRINASGCAGLEQEQFEEEEQEHGDLVNTFGPRSRSQLVGEGNGPSN